MSGQITTARHQVRFLISLSRRGFSHHQIRMDPPPNNPQQLRESVESNDTCRTDLATLYSGFNLFHCLFFIRNKKSTAMRGLEMPPRRFRYHVILPKLKLMLLLTNIYLGFLYCPRFSLRLNYRRLLGCRSCSCSSHLNPEIAPASMIVLHPDRACLSVVPGANPLRHCSSLALITSQGIGWSEKGEPRSADCWLSR